MSASDQVTLTVLPDPTVPVVVAAHRLNAGGPQLTNSIGTFAADNYFSPAPGYTYTTAKAIAGTLDDAMYQTERSSTADNGSFNYALPVSSGKYTVVLHFAELYWYAVGQRVFDVALEGALVLDNYDIFKKVGANFTATTESFVVDVTDGTLNLDFSALASSGGVNRPKVSAIEVIPFQGTAQARVALTGSGKPETNGTAGLVAYPNPFRQEINLSMEGAAAGTYTVKVLDLLGRQLYQSGFTAGAAAGKVHTINMSDQSLSRGALYLIVVEQAAGPFRKVIKMIKE
jgi:hypothetical protein